MRYLETQDVARALDLSPVRVRQLADAGQLPVAMKTAAGRRLYDPEAVEMLRRARARLHGRRRPGGGSARLAARRLRGGSARPASSLCEPSPRITAAGAAEGGA